MSNCKSCNQQRQHNVEQFQPERVPAGQVLKTMYGPMPGEYHAPPYPMHRTAFDKSMIANFCSNCGTNWCQQPSMQAPTGGVWQNVKSMPAKDSKTVPNESGFTFY